MTSRRKRNWAVALRRGRLIGSDRSCEYYPCHFESQDCTWCYCPFYPCNFLPAGGKMMTASNGSMIWNCKECSFVHRPEIAKRILTLLAVRGKEGSLNRSDLMKIFFEVGSEETSDGVPSNP